MIFCNFLSESIIVYERFSSYNRFKRNIYPLGEDFAVDNVLLTEKYNFQLKDFEGFISK